MQHPVQRSRIDSLRYVVPMFGALWEICPLFLVGSVGLRVAQAFFPVIMLWIPKLIIDAVVKYVGSGGSLAHIWKLIALEIGLAVTSDLLGRAISLSDSLLSERFVSRMGVRLIRHAEALDLAAFEDPTFQDKLDRGRRQTSGRLGLMKALLSTTQDFVSLLTLTTGLILFSPWLMGLLIISVVPAFIGEGYFSKLTYSMEYRRTAQRRSLDYLRFLCTSSQSIKELKLFGLASHFIGQYSTLAGSIEDDNRRVAIRRAIWGFGLGLISIIGLSSATVVVLMRTVAGAISLGMFTFLTRSFARSRMYIERILSTFNQACDEALYFRDLFEFFDMRPTVKSKSAAIPAPRPIRDGFSFEDVSFAYPGASQPVVRGINLRFHAAEKVALIGQNGSGKSTIVKLLTRLYDPTGGRILLDGVDLRDYEVEHLRRQIGVILQDYVRYDALLRENIGFGMVDALSDEQRVWSAARRSQARSVIEKFPPRLNQMVGRRFEGGIDLSGGEWQKLAIARAFMRDAQVFILDEPTAALDARAEYEVFECFADLIRGRMALLISHRLSTARVADRIVVLADGQIEQEGTHRQLLDLKGRYAELFSLQAAGYR